MSNLDLFGPNCAFCNKFVSDYKPEDYSCCNGRECGCQGLPTEPCICSVECSKAFADRIGTIEERAKKYNIKLHISFYENDVVSLKNYEVFVFGANLNGFHGGGSAGYASFNISGNRWREFDYANKPNGWKGKWNVKGIGEGFQEGEIGKSYAIPTVTKAGAKRSRTPQQIIESIKKFYDFAHSKPNWQFLVAQDNKTGLNGYKPEEMRDMFNFCGIGEIPLNVYFKKEFANLF